MTVAWLFSDEATEATDRLPATLIDSRAFAHQLSVYDAMYLELAMRLRMPLATLDRALTNAALTTGVDVPEVTK